MPRSLLALFALLAALTGCASVPYAQLSAPEDQTESGTVRMGSIDAIRGLRFDGDTLTVGRGGDYLLVAAPQVTAIADLGCAEIWFRKNGVDIPNSNVRLCMNAIGETDVIVSQGVTALEAGDRVQVMAELEGVILDAIELDGQPLIPAIIFTAYAIN